MTTPEDTPSPCPKCGAVHDPSRCPGHRRNGDQCGLIAGWGTDHAGVGLCRKHAGNTPNGKTNAMTLTAHADARALMEEEMAGVDPSDIAGGMLDVIRRSTARHRAIDRLVGALALDELYGADHLGDARPHVLIEMLERAETSRLRALDVAARMGVQERLVRIVEAEAEELAALMHAHAAATLDVLRRVGAPAELVERVTELMPSVMRAVLEERPVVIDADSEEIA